MARKPNNGPSFSKAPAKKVSKAAPASPARALAQAEQTARDAAKSRQIHKALNSDPAKALEMLGLVPKKRAQIAIF
ncbi:MAG: hypothetical protein KF750_16450 [Xanthobacteraceae bacterium]|nr:hypothetical protein [Xanthobacteraceae bacterium]